MCADRSRVTPPWFSTDDPADNVLNDANLGRMAQLDAHRGAAEPDRDVPTEVATVTRFSWTWLDSSGFQRLPARGNVYTDLPRHQAKGRAHWEQVSEKGGRLCIIRIKTS